MRATLNSGRAGFAGVPQRAPSTVAKISLKPPSSGEFDVFAWGVRAANVKELHVGRFTRAEVRANQEHIHRFTLRHQ